jgi:hypothetical protein
MVINIVLDHPPDVPLGPAHLLFFLAFPFPFEPALHPKARAKVGGLALKGDLIDRPLPVIFRFFVLLYRCSQIRKVAQRLVPPLLGTVSSRLLPLLTLLLSEARQGESALHLGHAFFLRLSFHRNPHDVVLTCLPVLLSRATYRFCHATTCITCCDKRAAGTKRETLQLSLRDGVQAIASRYTLPPNWLNYLTQMLIYDKIIMPRGKLWKRYGPLQVYAPPKEYILALKILAGRDQDLADCRILLPQTRIRTRKQAQRVLDRYLLPEAQQDEAATIASSLDVLFGSESAGEP